MAEINGEHLIELEPDRANPLTAELEDYDGPPHFYREAAQRFNDKFFAAACCVKGYKGNQLFAYDCVLAAFGGRYWTLLGVRDQEGLAKKWGCTKANVCKLVNKFQGPGYLNLPPMPGQRELNGRRNMAFSRKQQLQ